MKHEIVHFPNGTASLKPDRTGHKTGQRAGESAVEAMHSMIGPEAEARLVYVEQTALRERLGERLGGLQIAEKLFVLYDVGMGIAANALAAIECWENIQQKGRTRALHLISFENDTEGLEQALGALESFPFLRRKSHEATELLRSARVTGGATHGGAIEGGAFGWIWELRRGDFLKTVESAPPADGVFYDFYSPAVCPELWGIGTFKKIRLNAGGILVTYVASTSARAAMLLAGFAVGEGKSTAAKKQTTVAVPGGEHSRLAMPLGEPWLAKVERSSQPYPVEWRPACSLANAEVCPQDSVKEKLLSELNACGQFRSCSRRS